MAVLLHHMFTFSALFSYGLYHLISAARSHLKPQHHHHHLARPYYSLPLSSHRHHLLRHLPLYLAFPFLLLSSFLSLISSSSPNPLSPTHRFTSLQFSAVLFLFFLIAVALLVAHSNPSLLPLPFDLAFLLCSLAFALLSSVFFHSTSAGVADLQSKCYSISAIIAAASAALSLVLSVSPRTFIAELALAASISLQGLWSLQTGLSLYVEGFIPEGCHRLLDVPGGSDGSTRCDLEESRVRAAALLDLAFVMHVTFVAVVTVVVYAGMTRALGGGNVRRIGSYEALPTSSSGGALSDAVAAGDHVQMKAIGKNSMQA